MSADLPDSYEAIYQEALTQMGLGNNERATELMLRIVHRLCRLRRETLERKPDLQNTLMNAWHSAIEFLRWEKQYDRAIELCESVSDCLPERGAGPKRIASLMIEKGETEEGLSRMRQIAEENSTSAHWIDLATEYTILERYDEAEKCYQTALSLAGSNEEAAMANLGLFEVYSEKGNVDQALGAWNMAVVLNQHLAEHATQVYTWLIERGDLGRAQQYLARERNPIRYTFYQGLLDWEAGKKEAARDKWRRVLDMEIGPENIGVEEWMEAALRLNEPGKVTELEDKLTEKNYTFSMRLMILLGTAHVLLGEMEEARNWLDWIVTRLRRAWPSRERIPEKEWAFVTSLLPSKEHIQEIAPFFEVGEQRT